MQLAIEEADRCMQARYGGPFGACIVRASQVLAVAGNTVLRDHDATAHAEINAIRAASSKLGRHRLNDCVMFATCEPCPMCLGAIYWARISEVYFGCTRRDAERIGFADRLIYDDLARDIAERTVTFHPDTAGPACRQLMQTYLTLSDRPEY